MRKGDLCADFAGHFADIEHAFKNSYTSHAYRYAAPVILTVNVMAKIKPCDVCCTLIKKTSPLIKTLDRSVKTLGLES